MQVKPSQASSMIAKFIRARIVPMLEGSPGCGKSQINHKIAIEYNLKLIDLRLSQCDPTDLLGFPQIVNGKADYVPMSTFPIEGDPVPAGYVGWLLFLDEFNSAPPAVQAAAYKLVLDRMVGSHHLHKNVAIVCAGNKDTDNAIVQPMSTAMQSRLSHIELVVDKDEWVSWASEAGIDHRITSFMNFKPGNLFTFHPDHTDKTYACPRTWEFADRVLQIEGEDSKELLPMLAGTISEGVAREFIGFCKIHKDLVKIPQIILSPETVSVPSEPSILYAMTGAIAHNATPDTIKPLMIYLNRFPKEFQVICLREALRRNKELAKQSAVLKWISQNAVDLF